MFVECDTKSSSLPTFKVVLEGRKVMASKIALMFILQYPQPHTRHSSRFVPLSHITVCSWRLIAVGKGHVWSSSSRITDSSGAY